MTNLFISSQSGGTANKRLANSADGLTYTSETTTTFNNGSGANWPCLAYAPEIDTCVAILDGSVSGNPTLGPVMYSTDKGVTWTATATNMLGQTWNDVCWANALGLFIACASSGTNRIATSPDGITWTLHSITANSWRAVAWSPELALAVVVGDTNTIFKSTDGSTWATAGTLPGTSKNWTAICWAGDGLGGGQQKFCATTNSGGGSNDFIYSSDGDVWSQRNLSGSAFAWGKLKYSSDLDMVGVVGGNTGVFCHSTDVTTGFTQISSGIGSNPFVAICWSKILTKWFIANTSNIYTSPDGTTWTSNAAGGDGSGTRLVPLESAPVNTGSLAKGKAYWLLSP